MVEKIPPLTEKQTKTKQKKGRKSKTENERKQLFQRVEVGH